MNAAMSDHLGSSNSQTISNNSFFTPLFISITGLSAAAVAIVFYHLLLVKYCIRRHTTRMAALRTFDGEEILIGVDEKTLSTLPIITYKKSGSDTHQCECPVCLVELENEDIVRLLPECKHLFHLSCIDEWFKGHRSCPVCRVPVVHIAPTPPDEDNSCPVCRVVATTTDERTSVGSNDQTYGSVGFNNRYGYNRTQLMLRHCKSLVLPGENKGRFTGLELKRSLSVGQIEFVVIDINIDHWDKSYTHNPSFRDQPSRKFQRLSTMVKESIPRMFVGQEQGSGILAC